MFKTIRGFQLILSGELDGLPEQAFYLVGNIDEGSTKAITLEEENKSKKWNKIFMYWLLSELVGIMKWKKHFIH